MAINGDYFAGLSAALKGEGIARPVILLDLDRVDHNLDLISDSLDNKIRIVTKSLPSLDILKYAHSRTGTNRMMAFHLPFVKSLLHEFPNGLILMGKPFLKNAIHEFFESLRDPDQVRRAVGIEWLVDTPESLVELANLASERGLRLKANLEIDIGLHRGGISSADAVKKMASILVKNRDVIEWSGVMGYEAHVPHYPDPDAEFTRSMARFANYVDDLISQVPDVQLSSLTLNSGGSSTYDRFNKNNLVNDVSVGSALIKPATFKILKGHLAALFIAAPVIRKFPTESRSAVNKNEATSLYLYGGGWAADIVYPENISISPYADPPNQNLLPNQSLYLTNEQTVINRSDFVYFWPQQSDAMFQFEDIWVVRNGVIIDRWKCFSRRF